MRARIELRVAGESNLATNRAVDRRRRHSDIADHRRVEQLGHLLDSLAVK